ncbi:MAG: tetratricopeptide repeat protein [Actinomycetota bacterium]
MKGVIAGMDPVYSSSDPLWPPSGIRPGAPERSELAAPGSVYDLYARGVALLRDGHPHQAVTVLARAKAREPEKVSIREALGRALFMSGHARRARREFTKAVALQPTDDYAHFALALACERTGQRSRALGHAKLAQAMNPAVPAYGRALRRLTA